VRSIEFFKIEFDDILQQVLSDLRSSHHFTRAVFSDFV
jgi:hypothetical protein